MAERRFDDKEVGEILKAAAEMQSGISTSGSSLGMTLAELQAVAQEVGIDPAHIDRAATELASTSDTPKRNGLDSFFVQHSVKGQLSEEGWDELVTELRRHTGKRGKIEINGQSREWVGNSDVSSVTLNVTFRGGRTRLKLFGETAGASALAKAMGLAFGFIVALIPVIVSVKLHPHVSPGLTLFLSLYCLGMWIAMVIGFIRMSRKKFGTKLDALLSRLAALAEAGVDERNELGASANTPIDLSGMDLSDNRLNLRTDEGPKTVQGA